MFFYTFLYPFLRSYRSPSDFLFLVRYIFLFNRLPSVNLLYTKSSLLSIYSCRQYCKKRKKCLKRCKPTSQTLYKLLVTGIEPVRCCHHRILSPARLPVPPHQHDNLQVINGTYRARTYDPLLVRQMLSQLS